MSRTQVFWAVAMTAKLWSDGKRMFHVDGMAGWMPVFEDEKAAIEYRNKNTPNNTIFTITITINDPDGKETFINMPPAVYTGGPFGYNNPKENSDAGEDREDSRANEGSPDRVEEDKQESGSAEQDKAANAGYPSGSSTARRRLYRGSSGLL